MELGFVRVFEFLLFAGGTFYPKKIIFLLSWRLPKRWVGLSQRSHESCIAIRPVLAGYGTKADFETASAPVPIGS